MKYLLIILALFTVSCVTPIQNTETIQLKRVTVYVCPDSSYFPPTCTSYFVKGCATHKNEIYVIGEVVDGKIITNDTILGHELRHLLNWKNPVIKNPDH